MPDKTNKELALEVQELRQCLIQVVSALRNNAFAEYQTDYWWDKLSNYPGVER